MASKGGAGGIVLLLIGLVLLALALSGRLGTDLKALETWFGHSAGVPAKAAPKGGGNASGGKPVVSGGTAAAAAAAATGATAAAAAAAKRFGSGLDIPPVEVPAFG